MNGILKSKTAIKTLIEPLQAMDKVLSNSVDKLHIVYEEGRNNETPDGSLFIKARDAAGMALAMYKVQDPSKIFDNYEKIQGEIGINNVSEFVNVINSFEENLNIKYEKGRFDLFSGSRRINYMTSDPTHIKKGKNSMKTSEFEVDAAFVLSGKKLQDLKKDFSLFVLQDTVTFAGHVGENCIDVMVTKMNEENSQHSYNNSITDVTINKDFEIRFPKDILSQLFSCHDKFDITFFNGKKAIGEFKYATDTYSMNFYISPKLLTV